MYQQKDRVTSYAAHYLRQLAGVTADITERRGRIDLAEYEMGGTHKGVYKVS